MKNKKQKKSFYFYSKIIFLFTFAIFFIFFSIILIYVSTLKIPDFSNFENRKIQNSTQIYDRTGKVLLFDLHKDIKRIQVKSEDISVNVKNATIAIEDKNFYSHNGVRPTSLVRAFLANLKAGKIVQGGSTIDQQIIKNALLDTKKNIVRKIKEWALSVKLDKQLSKDSILTIYLNEASYGGNIYGIETASKYFFNKKAKNLSILEAAYLAALPNAPTFYSPFGKNLQKLEERKNLILKKMFEQKYIKEEEYKKALTEKVVWNSINDGDGKALHFIFFVKDYLEKKYGEEFLEKGGLKIITTIDYNLQKKGEEIVKKYALENAKKYHATNAGLIAVDPKTGQLLTMVGSRDYFDKEIPGKFNITTSLRQPGSAFKPIVYATAFEKGFNPNSVLFDVDTEFNTYCDVNHEVLEEYKNNDDIKCYAPKNYNDKFLGPINLRNSLAQSINVSAVKLLYLVGVKNAISTAEKLGITSLDKDNNYGLSLVLGAGEVSLLQITNGYAVFANNGLYNPLSFILSVEDKDGNILENYSKKENQVLESYITYQINDVLSDNVARTPLYGANSGLYFKDRPVAAKTGTTNSFRDTWVIGYTPNFTAGVWAGNNDNTPINNKLSGLIVVPLWSEFMNYALQNKEVENFIKTEIPKDFIDNNILKINPITEGIYCGGGNINSFLETNNPQYNLWNFGEEKWVNENGCVFN